MLIVGHSLLPCRPIFLIVSFPGQGELKASERWLRLTVELLLYEGAGSKAVLVWSVLRTRYFVDLLAGWDPLVPWDQQLAAMLFFGGAL